jgi:50S ribosomal subunit-associated GTPase HflX
MRPYLKNQINQNKPKGLLTGYSYLSLKKKKWSEWETTSFQGYANTLQINLLNLCVSLPMIQLPENPLFKTLQPVRHSVSHL